MELLIIGLLMWWVVHLFPSVAAVTRANLVNKFGLGPYKACFALLIVISVVIMVFGWRSIEPADIYIPPAWGKHVTYLLVLLTFILFIAAKRKTNIKRMLRHPQLTGLVLWSIGHLFANGDHRSLVLFIGLGVWAILEMAMINRRTGTWIKPDPVPVKAEVITVLLGSILFAALFLVHPYLAGVKLVP
jgi:uncharacterized membrane protein